MQSHIGSSSDPSGGFQGSIALFGLRRLNVNQGFYMCSLYKASNSNIKEIFFFIPPL